MFRPGAHGWNADQFGFWYRRRVSTAGCPLGDGGWERVVGVLGVVGTLLGPEGAGFRVSSDRVRTTGSAPGMRCPGWRGRGVGRSDRLPVIRRPLRGVMPGGGRAWRSGGRVCPYLENCTVDASIFVAKLLRAHGGCLGTRSR